MSVCRKVSDIQRQRMAWP